jgi:type IV pilus assembly protein PilC
MHDMIRTGEESGSLLQLLSHLSELYENELEQWVAGMNSLLEPLIISLLGLIVGSLVLAMYLPIFKLSSII